MEVHCLKNVQSTKGHLWSLPSSYKHRHSVWQSHFRTPARRHFAILYVHISRRSFSAFVHTMPTNSTSAHKVLPVFPVEKPAHLTNLRASYTRDDLLAEHESFAPIPSCLQWFWQRRESDPPLHHAEPSSIPRCSTRDSHLDRQTSSHHRLLLHRKNRFHKNRNWENVSKTSIIAHSCASLSLSPRQRT